MQIEVNPDKIKEAEIVVGIPSYNEADTIVNVVKQVDRGLNQYFPDKSKVIINSDNNSPDNTKEAFLQTETKTPKIYISTPEGVKGKGNNLRNLFEKIKDLDARFAMTVDADIKSIAPDWVNCLISPQIEGYDFITPVYYRHKYDGFITNHLCYPIIYGVLGYNIRQPIGGDMGFSRKMVEKFLEQEWSDDICNYGIDIFMTLSAIKFEIKLAQADLGVKAHKPSTFKLDAMFLQVANTLFNFLKENKSFWQKKVELKTPPLVAQTKERMEINELPVNHQEIKEKAFFEFSKNYEDIKKCFLPDTLRSLEKMYFEDKSLEIDIDLWTKIIYEIIYRYVSNHSKETIIKSLRALYYGRVTCYMDENSVSSNERSEKLIREKVHHFFEKRDYLLSLFS